MTYERWDGVRRIRLHIRVNLKSQPIDTQTTFGSEEFELTFAAPAGARLPIGVHRCEIRIFEQRVLSIGSLAMVFEGKSPAARRDRHGTLGLHGPLHDIQLMRPEVGHLTAGIIP